MWAAVPGIPWIPHPGVTVKDTARGRLGKVIAWDGDARTVTLVPPDGGEPWETDAFRPEGAAMTTPGRTSPRPAVAPAHSRET